MCLLGISLIASCGVGKHYVVVYLVYKLNVYLNCIEIDMVLLNRTLTRGQQVQIVSLSSLPLSFSLLFGTSFIECDT